MLFKNDKIIYWRKKKRFFYMPKGAGKKSLTHFFLTGVQ